MVAWPTLAEHGFALLLLWTTTTLPGLVLLPYLRLRIGVLGAPLLGVVYWTLSLYLFPFAGGLDLAAGFILMLAMFAWRKLGKFPSFKLRGSFALLLLALGSLPYASTLLVHYLPFGMDGSMHTTAATLIARSHGLPSDYAPFAPEVSFLPINLGLPAVAAVAIRCGGEPAAVMLAAHHLTFTCLILATYLLLRWWTGRTSAAVLAVASVWMARATQASLGWGGFPTVLSVAIGLLACRLLLLHARSFSWRCSLGCGATIAAIPLIHGVGGGSWVYCVGPWAICAALWQAKSQRSTWAGLAVSGIGACVFLLIYRLSGNLNVQPADMETTRRFVQENAVAAEGWRAWLASGTYVRKDAGSLIVLAGWAACLVLAWRKSWRPLLLVTAAWLTLITVVANARWYVLPGSFLLYPDRVIYWAAPCSAVAVALVWRSLPLSWRGSWFATMSVLGLLLMAGYSQNQFYQKIVRTDFADGDSWAALQWAKHHLDPRRDFVQASYNTAGSFLPAVAQIACTGSHQHHFLADAWQQSCARRPCTHRFLMNPPGQAPIPSFGSIVFQNRAITIVALTDHRAANLR